MTKKSNVNISPIAVLRLIIFLFIAWVLFSIYVHTFEFLTGSSLFKVKDVMIDRSIEFIDLHALKTLKGTNIFKIDIKKLGSQIAHEYPYIAQLRVVRQLPDRILILAKKRDPFMQIFFRDKFLLMDKEGVALYYVSHPLDLVTVNGIYLDKNKVVLGLPIHQNGVDQAVSILNTFANSAYLKRWKLTALETSNLSRIDLTALGSIHIILDQEDTKEKILLLPMLIAGHKIDLNQVKYIDLRFKEPVIANNTTP